jgi:hypothetical protein
MRYRLRSSFAPPFAAPPLLALLIVPTVCGLLASCQSAKTPQTADRRSHQEAVLTTGLTAALTGVDVADQTRDDIRYLLLCQGREVVAGTVTTVAGHDVAQFSAPAIADGDSCAIEVRAKPADEYDWLSDPVTPGLYYASSEGKVAARQLDVTLYKVYRERTPAVAGLVVQLTDGGTCERFDTTGRACPATPGDAAPQGACVFADKRLSSLQCVDGKTEVACAAAFKAGHETDPRLFAHRLFAAEACAAYAPGTALPDRAPLLAGLSLETLANGDLGVRP